MCFDYCINSVEPGYQNHIILITANTVDTETAHEKPMVPKVIAMSAIYSYAGRGKNYRTIKST